MVHTDNNPLTYIFSTANLDAAVQDYLSKIPYPGVKAVLDNAITPLIDRAEQGVRPSPDCQNACQEETLGARPVRLATTNITDWKLEQKEDPVLEWMNQTIIRMIGKLEQDKKARWSEHLPEMLSAYNGTRSAVTGYSPYFLLFGRKARMPVDYLFPTLCDSPHQTKMEVSVAAMQKRLKEAFAVARHLTSQEAAKQWCYYDRKAGAVALQPGDVVMGLYQWLCGQAEGKGLVGRRGFYP